MTTALTSSFGRYAEQIGSLLSPPRCAFCELPLPTPKVFCDSCALGLVDCDPEICATCDRPAGPRGLCRSCARRLAPLTGLRCAYAYEGPLAGAIQQLKYRGREELGALLSQLFAERLARPGDPMHALLALESEPASRLVPIPLHPRRLRQRGFDQAWLLARPITKALGLKAEPRALVRTRDTRPQVGLRHLQRAENLAGAFEAAIALGGERPVLLDDVCTTGATLAAAAAAACRAGARAPVAVALARAEP